ncbi:RsmB/NOP family class I SAM-dependent RNA methyltransferase [Rhodopila globiformis]|uniref:rRNA cytosine-C5-methylase n=1 Tax=Rhodopila globiformis TaxID=1071 RepID=A0A2S6NC95_RHOGL|nr:RsmB/NOP family class I SAM-dependent RNA methyltransferase [Rhodopila globiformis]PPQ32227.1 rRNA cytosine-C5-methylase [Rhodopila globiformis]
MTPAARIAAAIDLLTVVEGAPKRPADAVANDFFRSRRYIGSGDRRAISDRVWRVLRARRRLGWWLGDAPATPRLLVAASLLLEGWAMSGIAQSFSGGQFAPPALDRAERAVAARLEGHTLDHPAMPDAVMLEVPDWLLPRLQSRFGAALTAELAALSEPATLDLRVNLLKGDCDQARAALAAEGWDAKPTPFSPWGLRIEGRRPVTDGPAFRSGLIEIQDEGSQLVALMVGAAPGMRVVDWCAGAGGKTLALAAMMQNRGQVVACDVSAPRLEGAVRRLRRAEVHNVERHLVTAGDKWLKRRAGTFDRVLVDAPCSGTGTWRRNPDARLRLKETDLCELLPKQAMILDDAQSLVRKGGRLVYATCSLLEEENEAQVSGFLLRHPEFALVPLARAWPLPQPAPGSGDVLFLTPARHRTDGFFAAVLERVA